MSSFNLLDILYKYENNEKKAIKEIVAKLKENKFSIKEIALITAVAESYYKLKQEEDEKGLVEKRKSIARTTSYTYNYSTYKFK